MKFFLDSAHLPDIKAAANKGWVDGVTTNPSLLSKEMLREGNAFTKPEELLLKICSAVSGPVSLEVLALDAPAMIKEGEKLAALANNVVVKVPLTEEGLIATRALSALKIKTNVTLVFSPVQALVAAKAGATYVSPFVGRLDDIGCNGMDVVQQILDIYSYYDFSTQVLVASVRHPDHVLQAALMGADVVTAGLSVIKKLAQHPMTDKGLDQFMSDAKKGGLK